MVLMAPRKRITLVLAILVLCVGCDQKTKYLARERLQGRDAISLLAGAVRLDYTENQGGFLSLGAFLPATWRAAVFTIGCSAAIAAVLSYTLAAARAGLYQVLGLSLMCGGGIGNVIDRLAY